MVDSHLNPSLSPLQPTTDPLRGEAERALRGVENERMMREIAARICESARTRTRERRRTQVYLQPLGLPVFVAGKRCLCAVREHFVLSHPREHDVVTYWFETVEAAQVAFPKARLLTLLDYRQVGGRA